MNHAQNRTLHGLLTKRGLLEQKGIIVYGFTNGRSESCKDLSFEEAAEMIDYLKSQDKTGPGANKMRRKIISLAHEMHWHLNGTQAIDMPRLNGWCQKYGYLHKKLNDYTYKELPKLLTQFQLLYKDYLTNI
jgi:hypothetical protein